MAVLWRTSAFQQKRPETRIFIVFWGCALFGPRCQKKEILKSHPKRKNLTDNWKVIFWCFCCFGGLLFFFFFLFSLFFPHLALNPPYLFFLFVFCFVYFVLFILFCLFCFFFCFVFVFVFWFFFGGFKGQVRLPEGPPHLALNPPYLFFCFVFCFLSLLFNTKETLFSPRKGPFLFICSVPLSFFLP